MTTEQQIKDLLFSNPPAQRFVPYSFLSESGALTVYLAGDADYSEQVTDDISVYRSLDTDEIVGCRIEGAAEVMRDVQRYCHSSSLSAFLLAYRGGLEGEARYILNTLARKAMALGLAVSCPPANRGH